MRTIGTWIALTLAIATRLCVGELLRENYESVRGAGMGNAFVAVADDSNAIWLNPAALAYAKGGHFNLFDITLGVDGLPTLNRLKNLVFANDSSGFLSLGTQYTGFNIKPTITTKYFGLSIYNQTFAFFDTSYMNFLGVDVPNVDVYAFNETGAVGALGFPITPYFALGLNVRFMLRSAIDANVTATDLLSQLGLTTIDQFETAAYDYLKQLAGVGYGIGLTLGMQSRIPLGDRNAPTLTLASVVEDVGQTTFTPLTSGTPPPPPLHPNYIAGAAVTWMRSKESKVTLSTELRHMLEPINFAKTAHIGLEYRHKLFGLRGGYSEGYFTYGFSFEALPHTRVHFASYAKELGSSYNERSQRWWVVQAIIGFNPY